MRNGWRNIHAVVPEDAGVAPFSQPENLRAEDVTAVVLAELVVQTRLRLVDLAEHVLRSEEFVHDVVCQVDVPLLEVLLDEAVLEAGFVAAVGSEPVEELLGGVHAEDGIRVDGVCHGFIVEEFKNGACYDIFVFEHVVIGLVSDCF